MTTTFEEAWFVNYLSNQTCINLTEISLGWISSLKTSLNPFKNSSGPQVNLCWECQISANFQGRGTFCRYLARDKISTFHILTCLPLCNLINLILNLYLRFFFLFEFTFLSAPRVLLDYPHPMITNPIPSIHPSNPHIAVKTTSLLKI